MDALFTIPYGEYAVADRLSKTGMSIFIPSSRQEKGIDLLCYQFDGNRNKITTVQVKQSRTYYENRIIKVEGSNIPVTGYLWFNRFKVQENAEWFMLIGTRVIHPKTWKKAGVGDVSWDPIILVYSNAEMKDFMDNVKQRKDPTKEDRMFGFWYDEKGNVFQTRGCKENKCVNNHLLENKIDELLNSLK